MTVVAKYMLELELNSNLRYPVCLDQSIILNPSRKY